MSQQENDFLKQLRATFKIEAGEHLETMSAGLLRLEQGVAEDVKTELIEHVFRAAHSLKGASRAVNLVGIESICQALESVFSTWKRGEREVAPEQFDVLHRALDVMGAGIPGADGELSSASHGPHQDLTREINNLLIGGRPPQAKSPTKMPPRPIEVPGGMHDRITPVVVDESLDSKGDTELAGPSSPAVTGSMETTSDKAGLGTTVRMSTAKLEKLLLEAEEMLTLKQMSAQRTTGLRGLEPHFELWSKEWMRIQPQVRELRGRSRASTDGNGLGNDDAAFERVHQAKLDVVKFLDWNLEHLRSLEGKIGRIVRTAVEDQAGVERRVNELLDDTKTLLLLPFSSLLGVFPKLVRELSREQGKDVALSVQGAEVEIDKRILEEMKDPLVHLVRNCIGHGIELPEERARQKKPPRATITISISRGHAGNIDLEVSDDGAGIDVAKVKEVALKKGVIAADAAAEMDESQALRLIFQSDVSTSPMITEISGRGIGMAIVREKAEALGGRVTVESRRYLGTTIQIVLPSTLASFRGVLVRSAGRSFVLPITNVERVTRAEETSIRTIENRETITLDGRVVSLVRLEHLLELARVTPPSTALAQVQLVLLNSGGECIALAVDEVLREEEVLVKALAKPLSRVRNVAGATVLGNGDVVPVLHIGDLMKSSRKAGLVLPGSRAAVADVKVEVKIRRILVAEDSITSRVLLKNVLEAAGHVVVTAVDGMEALAELRSGEFDLLVSDVEMPRMNGFDLTVQVRADRKLAGMPVILVTALSSREDRERGMEAGANAYIVKSSFDQSNLLDAVRRLA